jgi:chaperonin GroEL
MSWLGTCDRITATKEETIVTGIKDISDHIKVLEDRGTDNDKLRISWLKTKTAILKLGANSDSELSYLRGKATDARNSSYLALQEGVVCGGGIAYINAIKDLPNTVGGKILKEALKAPFKQIVENSEKDCKVEEIGGKIGFDSKKGKVVDMYEAGILDATVVVKNSLINALSVISSVLTTKPIILLKK